MYVTTAGLAEDTVTAAALIVLVVANVSPDPLGDVEKPDSVTAPALEPLMISTKQVPSNTGAARVNAPPFIRYWLGFLPQSTVDVPLLTVPRE